MATLNACAGREEAWAEAEAGEGCCFVSHAAGGGSSAAHGVELLLAERRSLLRGAPC